MAQKTDFTARDFLMRSLFAIALVLITVNPSGFSFYHWLFAPEAGPAALKVLFGVILLIGWVVYINATKNALGLPGALLVAVFFVALIWLLIELGLLRADSASAVAWLAELILAGILAIGISWSHIQRRISGQIDTDEIEG